MELDDGWKFDRQAFVALSCHLIKSLVWHQLQGADLPHWRSRCLSLWGEKGPFVFDGFNTFLYYHQHNTWCLWVTSSFGYQSSRAWWCLRLLDIMQPKSHWRQRHTSVKYQPKKRAENWEAEATGVSLVLISLMAHPPTLSTSTENNTCYFKVNALNWSWFTKYD